MIAGLNNSAAMGPDGLSVHIFKYGGDVIINAVNDIATQSMEEGVVPSHGKVLKLIRLREFNYNRN